MKRLEISKEDLKRNLNLIKERIDSEKTMVKPEIIAVVKANGMGLGLVEYTHFLIEQDIHFFGVANRYEAISLRQNGIQESILMMSEVNNRDELTELIKNDIILTIGNLQEKSIIEEISKELNKKVQAHLKIDTGFARYGFLSEDKTILEAAKTTENIEIIGCYTHFSKPSDEKWTRLQFERFQKWIPLLKEINSQMKFHVCASTGFLKYKDMWLDYVRLGSCLQGRVLENTLGFQKVGKLKTEIVTIKNIKKGYNISYSNEYKAKKDMRIAVINVRLYGWI